MAQIDLSISKLVLLPSIKNRAWSEVKNNVETIFHFAIRVSSYIIFFTFDQFLKSSIAKKKKKKKKKKELVKYNTLFSSLQSNKTQFNKIKQYIEW